MKIWINGASRGLGFDILKSLNQFDHEIVVLTNFPQEVKNFKRVKVIDKGTNVSQIGKIVEKAIKEYGFPEVLIHTSGGGMGISDVNVNFEMLDKVFYRNFSHIVEINHHLVLNKNSSNYLKILHIGSTAAKQAIGSVSYNVGKTCLDAYVRSAGNQLKDETIILCGINMGAYLGYKNSMQRLMESNEKEYNKFLGEKLPLGKMMTIRDIFPLVNFLICEDINFLRGSMLPVDAGESKAYN